VFAPPFDEPWPSSEQSLVHELDLLLPFDSFPSNQQTVVYQLFEHRLGGGSRAQDLAQLVARKRGPGAVCGYEVAQRLADQLLLARHHRRQRRLGVLRESAAHPTECSIALARKLFEMPVAQLPQLGGRERKQRQGTRLARHRVHHLDRKLGVFELVTGSPCRLEQNSEQVFTRRRADQL